MLGHDKKLNYKLRTPHDDDDDDEDVDFAYSNHWD